MTDEDAKILIDDMKRQPFVFKTEKERPNYHLIALQAAQTLPNNSLTELLSNADKIEYWLNEPERKNKELMDKLRDDMNKWNKKAPL